MARLTYTQIMAALADNTSGAITAAVMRDVVESLSVELGDLRSDGTPSLALVADTWTLVPLNVARDSTPNMTLNPTIGTITAGIAGEYDLDTGIAFQSDVMDAEIDLGIYVNGVREARTSTSVDRLDFGSATILSRTTLAAGDVIDIRVQTDTPMLMSTIWGGLVVRMAPLRVE